MLEMFSRSRALAAPASRAEMSPLPTPQPTPTSQPAQPGLIAMGWLRRHSGDLLLDGTLWSSPQHGEVPVELYAATEEDRGVRWFEPDPGAALRGIVWRSRSPDTVAVTVQELGPAYAREGGSRKAVEG
jgi:hypothetical protein